MKVSSLIRKYALDRYLNSGVIASIDMVLSVASTIITIFFAKLVISNLNISTQSVLILIVISAIATAIAILTMRTHRIIIRHSTIHDIWKLAVAVIVKEAIVAAAIATLVTYPMASVVVYVVCDAMIWFMLLVVTRMMMIVVYEVLKQSIISKNDRKNIFIYDTSDKSTALKMRLLNSKHYHVVGFLHNSSHQTKGKLAGSTIYSYVENNEEQMKQLFDMHNVTAVIFPNYMSLREEQEGLIAFCTSHKIKVLIAPPIDEVVNGNAPQNNIREIKIEDLLGRDEIEIPLDEVVNNFKDKVVMVTGAAGSIGSELCRQLCGFGIKRLVMFDNAETPMHNIRLELEETFPTLDIVPIVGDVRQTKRLEFVFDKHKPQVVFHAAAYKHVPLMEENPCEAILVNVDGSRNVADACVKHQAEMMVMISTDKAVNPTNIMGCTKRLAEIYVQSLGTAMTNGTVEGKTKFVTTRFGNVLGSNGSVIPRFREQIIKGGPITVTHPDITRFFMTIPEACRLVMEAATLSDGNQIFVFDMGKSVKIVNLAERMIELAGFTVGEEIKIKFTGLRPGEKLYEEVLSNAENTIETDHEKIRIAKVRQYNYADAMAAIDNLKQLALDVNILEMVKLMKSIVPEFKSKNSQFELLDK